jgi:DNA-binding response OmpR family regulator
MPGPNDSHVLVIEDDPLLVETLKQGLIETGYAVDTATDGEDGFYRATQNPPGILILDLNLPGRDGFEVLCALRRHHPAIRVLILSARDTVDDRIRGLDTGADDYLVKPFAFSELLARLRALARRDHSESRWSVEVEDLEIDLLTRHVTRCGKSIPVTPREFNVLELLARNAGAVVSRQMLAEQIWPAARATPLDNVIDVHIMHLRRKIDDGNQPPLLHTVRGLGFMLGHPPADPMEP